MVTVDALRNTELFQDLSDEMLGAITGLAKVASYEDGDSIYELGDDADEVLKFLNERGITRKLAKEALEVARQRGGFTIFALVDAHTRTSRKLANEGERSAVDQKASALLSLAK